MRWLLRWSIAITTFAAVHAADAVDLALPNRPGSVKFAVLGDFGDGHSAEYQVASQLSAFRARFPFAFVITTGDNMVGGQDDAADRVEKFERPFGPLLAAGVRFYATLGNHDKPASAFYPPWNMNGRRYYTFAVGNVRFFAVDSNRPDRLELAWLDEALRRAHEDWKVVYFHHPIYSNGLKHGPDLELRVLLEPLLVRHGVDVVFSGHQHVYERLTQRSISYFTTGAGGQETGTLRKSASTAASFDRDQTFTAVEVAGGQLFFQTVSRTGVTVDAGVIQTSRQTSRESGR